jgi:radical SAM protein with 4Fe4S-binding SPASM domain
MTALTDEYFLIKDSVIIRDERHFLNSGWYLVANPSEFQSWNVDADWHGLIEYMLRPRSFAEIEHYRASLPAKNNLAEPDRISAAFEALQKMGIIEQVSADSKPTRPSRTAFELHSSIYAPASAPISMSIQLPMRPDTFSHLMKEADELGVLGIDFMGGHPALQFLADESKALQGIRAAVAIWLDADDLTESTRELLSMVSAALGHHPFVVVKNQNTEIPVDTAAKIIGSLGIPFCVTYHILASDSLPEFKRIAFDALKAGATFAHFLLDENSFGADNLSFLEDVSEKLTVLGKVQWAHEPMQVQVRTAHVPLPYHVAVLAPNLRQLFSSYLGGCSAGLIAHPMPVHVRPIWVETVPPETDSRTIPRLPMNCCQAGMTRFAINEDGTVYPCEEAMGITNLVMGNLATNSLAEIWAGEQWAFFRGGWDLHNLSECHRCYACADFTCHNCRVRTLGSLGSLACTHADLCSLYR